MPPGPPNIISMSPSFRRHGPPTATRSSAPAPSARAARRDLARGGLGPRCQAGPPLNRSSTLPSVRHTAETGGQGANARPRPKARNAPHASARRARRSARKVSAASRRIHDAISTPVHGRGSTAAQGKAAARTHVRSKIQRPAPTSFAAAGAAAGTQASAAHSKNPPASKGPDNGTRMRLAKGPTREALPNTAIHNGHKAAAIATLMTNRAAVARRGAGHEAGAARSAASPAQRIAAQAPTLITALGESADAGSINSIAAAATVSAAEAVVSRPRVRAADAAASITQALTQGGSAPVINR